MVVVVCYIIRNYGSAHMNERSWRLLASVRDSLIFSTTVQPVVAAHYEAHPWGHTRITLNHHVLRTVKTAILTQLVIGENGRT